MEPKHKSMSTGLEGYDSHAPFLHVSIPYLFLIDRSDFSSQQYRTDSSLNSLQSSSMLFQLFINISVTFFLSHVTHPTQKMYL